MKRCVLWTLTLFLLCSPARSWGQAQHVSGNRVQTGWLNYGLTTGTGTAYVLTFSPAIGGYVDGQCFLFRAHTANTGDASLNVNAKGAIAMRKWSSGAAVALVAGDIAAQQDVQVCYDSTNGPRFQVQSLGGGTGTGVTDGDKQDITVSSAGTIWAIDPGAVTYAKMQNVNTARLLGRNTAGAGVMEELTAATVKTMLGITFGDITGAATDVQIPNLNTLSTGLAVGKCVETDGTTGLLIATPGPCGTATGTGIVGAVNFGAMYATSQTTGTSTVGMANGQLMIGRTGLSPQLGSITGTGITVTPGAGTIALNVTDQNKGDIVTTASGVTWTINNGVVNYAKLQNTTAGSVLIGRGAGAAGVPQEITVGGTLSFSGTQLIGAAQSIPDGNKGDITTSTAGTVWTINAGAVNYAKMQNVSATARIMGRNSAGAGSMEELTAGTVKTMLGVTFGDITGTATDAQIPDLNTLGTGLAVGRCVETHPTTGVLTATAGACGTATGTGITLATNFGAMYATGTTTGTSTPAMTNGQLMIGRTGLSPQLGSITGTGITVTPGAGTIALALTDTDHQDITTTSGGTIWTIDPGVVTYAKLQNTNAASVLIGRGSAAGAGVPQEITLGSGVTMVGQELRATTSGGDIAVSATGSTWTINNTAVSFIKMQNVNTARLIGRTTAAAGPMEELTAATAKAMLGITFGDITGNASDAQIPNLNTLSTGLAASQCVATDANNLLVSTGAACGAGGGSGITGGTNFGAMYATGLTTATSTLALGDGQILVGRTGLSPQIGTVGGTTNQVSVTTGPGTITVGLTPTGVTLPGTTTGTFAGSLTGATNLNLATGVTGDLPYANLTQATAPSRLLGRGAAVAGVGDWQEITLGGGLAMTNQVLSATTTGGDITGVGDCLTGQCDAVGNLIVKPMVQAYGASPITITLGNTRFASLGTVSAPVSILAPTGTAYDRETLKIELCSASPQTITWNAIFRAIHGFSRPARSTGGGVCDLFGFEWNQTAGTWDFVATSQPSLAQSMKSCILSNGRDNGTALSSADLGPQTRMCPPIGASGTVVEIGIEADAGAPAVQPERRSGATSTALLAAALPTGANGLYACKRLVSEPSQNGSTSCTSGLQNQNYSGQTSFGWLAGTADGIAKSVTVTIFYIPGS
jgi:hypothetical protein